MFRKQGLPFLLAFVVPLLVVYAWWGGFSQAKLVERESGPYRFAWIEHQGEIAKLPKTQARVHAILKQAGITPGETLTVLLTDPRKTPKKDQRARTGYIIPDQTNAPAGLNVETLPRRRVLAVSVHAVVMLAPGKAYQALYDHLHQQGRDITLPAVEIYRPSGSPMRVGELTVEIALQP